MRYGVQAFVLSIGLIAMAVPPAVAAPSKPGTEARHAALSKRVADLSARYGTNNKPTLDEVRALKADLEAAGIPEPGDYADLILIYAYTLAFARDMDGALSVVLEGERVILKAGDAYGLKLATLYLLHGQILDQKAQVAEGLKIKHAALAIYLKMEGEDSAMAATVRAQIAFSSLATGHLTEALTQYEQALPRMAKEASLVRTYAQQMSNYALALRLAGDYERSLETSRAGLAVARESLPDNHPATGFLLNTMGTTLLDMGRLSEAETVLVEALERAFKHRGKTSIDTAGAGYKLALVKIKQGDVAAGETLLNDAMANLEGVATGPNPDLPGLIRLEQARLAADRGDLAGAETLLRAGITELDSAGTLGDTTRSRLRLDLGKVLFLKGDAAAGLAEIETALVYLRAEVPPAAPDRVNGEMLRALILARTGRVTEAYEDATATEAVMTTRLLESAGRSDVAEIAKTYSLNYTRFAHIALLSDHPEAAFRAAQMAAFSEVSVTAQTLAVRAGLEDARAAELMAQLQTVQGRWQRLDRERSYARSKGATEESERLKADMAEVERDMAALRSELSGLFPAYDTLRRPQPQTLAMAQAALGPRQAVLMPLSADDALVSLVLTRGALVWRSANLSQAQINDAVFKVRQSVEAGLKNPNAAFDRQAAYRLGGALLPPDLRRDMGKVREIQVLGAGPILSLPLGILVTDPPKGDDADPKALRATAFVIKTYAVSVKPAFVTAKAAGNAPVSGFAGIGAPVLGPALDIFAELRGEVYRGAADGSMVVDLVALKTLPSLPGASGELQRMAAALKAPSVLMLIGAEATETAVKTTDLERYGVIAFATHGLIGEETGALREPALVLTPPETASAQDDGLLTASEVSALKLKAEWVILSACNTGSGREAGAAGYSGLAQAFMQAGAQTLLVSLWPVRDDAADRLSVETVRARAQGKSKPEALRQATLKLLRDKSLPPHPALWAPFSLISR